MAVYVWLDPPLTLSLRDIILYPHTNLQVTYHSGGLFSIKKQFTKIIVFVETIAVVEDKLWLNEIRAILSQNFDFLSISLVE